MGNQNPKPQQKPVQKKVDNEMQKKIDREKIKANIQKQLKQYDDKQKKLSAKVETLKQKAKDLVADNKKDQARKYLGQVQRLNKQIQATLVHKKAVLQNATQLQSADMTAQTAKILQQTKKHLDEHRLNSQKLLDLIQDANLRKREQQQLHERMKALVENDDDKEAQDEMLDELMREVEKEKKEKLKPIGAKQVDVKVPTQKVQERDEIQDMLNAL